ncbi:hypothetical protein CPB84DRAFT_1781918 [Gymnopilus junonius]|uniref:Uncharacterized protein n=1 Tax=Gymnopilus junonius TaxID=109634 RepID=A0A9P5TL27_GYMJU|nr:hypothetical protein CPB84DRAFT_1781918 [Gymnopilus junonius]
MMQAPVDTIYMQHVPQTPAIPSPSDSGFAASPIVVERPQEQVIDFPNKAPPTALQGTIISSHMSNDVESVSTNRRRGPHMPPNVALKYGLPEAVVSVRDGWQWTCQSGAVVSGLLASVAAQLLVFFKASSSYAEGIPNPGGAQGFLLASCYAALFLNISATISSFILIDNLGEIGFTMTTTQDDLLIMFGASKKWKWMLWHWLVTFYSGILALIIAVLTYVTMQEPLVTKIIMWIIVLPLTLAPTSYFIFGRPLQEE